MPISEKNTEKTCIESIRLYPSTVPSSINTVDIRARREIKAIAAIFLFALKFKIKSPYLDTH
tara:strand:+ start:595 stop:780 length:186 start_codon:yes stop_codon:yes gene_type:complete